MAILYTGPRFWDTKEMQDVTVRADINVVRSQWIDLMVSWAQERDMKIECHGYSTHTNGDNRWHEAHFYIDGADNRAMFLLAWS